MPTFVPTTGAGGKGKPAKSAFDFGANKGGPTFVAQVKANPSSSIGLVRTVADAFRRTGEPASAVAYLVQGKPREAVGSLQDIYREREKVKTIGLSDVPVIKKATGKLPWYVRAPTRFAIDIAGDPLTYLTFGTAGVGRGASGKAVARFGGREAQFLAGKRIATSAARTPESLPRLQDIARGAALTALERKGLDPALQVGLRIPFTREKSLTLAGVNLGKAKRKAASLGSRVPGATRLGASTRESFLPSRGAGKGMTYIHQSVRRAAEVEARAWQKEAQDLGRRIYQRARQEGVKPADLNRLIARHIDNPAKYEAPAFAQDLVADTRAIFERIGVRELADGVRRESRENYIPHLLVGDKDVAKLQARYADSAMSTENPFFVREREAPNFDALDAIGVRYETNIERLIEARAAASARARTKLAVDQATFENFGVARPLEAVKDAPAGNSAELLAASHAPMLDKLRGEYVAATDKYRRAQAVPVGNLSDLRQTRRLMRQQRNRVARMVATGRAQVTDIQRYDQAIADLDGQIRAFGKQGKNPENIKDLARDARVAQQRLVTAGDISRRGVEAARKSDAEALAAWEREVAPVIARNKALSDLPVARLASTEEWRQLKGGWEEVATSPRFKDALLPPQAAKDLRAVHKAIADSMSHPAAPLRFLRQMQGTWKRLALATPGFHVRNQYEDALRAWWAGARNPQSYTQAARILRGGEGSVKVKGRTLTNQEVMDLARTHGVVDVGFVAQEAASSEAMHRMRMDVMRHGAGRRVNWLRGSEQLGSFREDWNRMGLFLERLKAGDNPVEAAMTVRKYLFDYGEVGQFVNVARRYWMPFITYASKALPVVVGEMARRPGRISHIAAAQRIAMEEAGNPDLSGLAPEDQFALPLPLPLARALASASGAGDQQMLLNPKGVMGYTMLADVADLGSWKGTQRVAGNYLSPFVTKPFELATGHRLYTGNQAADRAKANALAVLMSKVPGADRTGMFGPKKDLYTGQQVPGINSRLDLLLRMVPPYTQIGSVAEGVPGLQSTSTSPRIGTLRTMLGLPVMPYDRAKAEYYARRFGGQ